MGINTSLRWHVCRLVGGFRLASCQKSQFPSLSLDFHRTASSPPRKLLKIQDIIYIKPKISKAPIYCSNSEPGRQSYMWEDEPYTRESTLMSSWCASSHPCLLESKNKGTSWLDATHEHAAGIPWRYPPIPSLYSLSGWLIENHL